MTTALNRLLWPALMILLGACASDISPSTENGGDSDGGDELAELPGPGGAQIRFADAGDYYSATVDASGSDWVYLDVDSQTQVAPASPQASEEWDIAFLGTAIKLNGGVSGTPPAGLPVVVHADKVETDSNYPFETIDGAPPEGAVDYLSDEAGGAFAQTPDYAMTRYPDADRNPNLLTGAGDHGWYYDSGRLSGNEISARANVGYVLRTVECRYYKLRMTGYVDGSGAAGHPQFDLLEIPGNECTAGGEDVAPLGLASFEIGSESTVGHADASGDDAWVYLDLSNAQQVAPAEPSNETTWDIAMMRSDIKMNGGVSGSGEVALDDRQGADWSMIVAAGAAAEWHVDEAEALAFVNYPPAENTGDGACGGINGDFGWYYYSGFCNDGEGMHHISPRDVVYVLRGRDGNYWKLRMLSYYDEAGTSAQLSFEYAPIAAP
ncbi:MAG: HmuY family protein [Gammaproteobacteria bacterium]|nr:HmuY family protein [Gammaproteobacteria bacterium]